MAALSAGIWPRWRGDAIGPYLYVQPSARSYIHVGARYFRDPWQRGPGAWLTVCVRGRILILRRWGA